MEIEKTPVIIIGSGIAGLLTALKLSANGVDCTVVTKSALKESSSWMAQGGIAAVLPENSADSLALHLQDTLLAGAGLTDEAVARSILSEGHLAIADLIALGVPFDRQNGKLSFTKEAAHTTPRILHAGGDATGRSIQDTLIHKVRQDARIRILDECMAVKLLVRDNRCHGVEVVRYGNDEADNLRPKLLLAAQTVLATGGIGRLYSHTTNPAIATGDGLALAALAGVVMQDMEFVQFHPTAFWASGQAQFLISEAMRGEGGILRAKTGRAFARDADPAGELAPRDILTRAICAQLRKDHAEHVWLDMTHLPSQALESRFPTILQSCLRFGVDIRKDWIPVAPAAHYGMGGVRVDERGRTSLPGLSAVGEVVSSGLHGANRLASNSLLECVVLARRVAADAQVFVPHDTPIDQPWPAPMWSQTRNDYRVEIERATHTLQNLMWNQVGILRDAAGLESAVDTLNRLYATAVNQGWTGTVPEGVTLRNMLITARLIAQGALRREESRGAHSRIDFTQTDTSARHTQSDLALSLRSEILKAGNR